MRIESLEIQNFSPIKNAKLNFQEICFLVGANGVGKSTVLAALNVFFRNTGPTHRAADFLQKSDFTDEDTSNPIVIEVTFCDLSDAARLDLSHYVRQDKLIVTIEAIFDTVTQHAPLKQFGTRLGIADFGKVFGATTAAEKKKEYQALLEKYPALPKWQNQAEAEKALSEYEAGNADLCVGIRSEDQFYGFTKGKGKLDRHIQWVYVPAVKDASQEQLEERNSAISQLVNVLVSDRSGLQDHIEELRRETRGKYQQLLDTTSDSLEAVKNKISEKLATWATPDISAHVEWSDEEKSISIQAPLAKVDLQDGTFRGEVSRFGHGLQRTYLFAVLQALAEAKFEGNLSLVIGCEEPELYQHPPQIRHLATVFEMLVAQNNQMIATTHSPLMVAGEQLEKIQRVCQDHHGHTEFNGTAFDLIAEKYLQVTGKGLLAPAAMMAKLNREIQPWIIEMLFCPFVVFVESREDQAYLTASLTYRADLWAQFRSLGIYIVPVFGKSNLLIPIIVAETLGIPFYAMFDLDSDCHDRHKAIQKQDNQNLFKVLGYDSNDAFSDKLIVTDKFAAWPNNITVDVKGSVDAEEWESAQNVAHLGLGNAPGLKKDPLALAQIVQALFSRNISIPDLISIRDKILEVAKR